MPPSASRPQRRGGAKEARLVRCKKIMAPVDLAHSDKLAKSLALTADIARLHDATVCYVGVVSPAPGRVARTPEEFRAKLDAFARKQAEAHGHRAEAHAEISHDPSAELEDALLRAERTTGADLIVMATHVPKAADLIWPSNGGRIATHASASVLLVRGG